MPNDARSATTSRPALIRAIWTPLRRNAASESAMPTHSASAVAGAPTINAPASAGMARRFSAPYFVSGICCIRIATTVRNSAAIGIGCEIQRWSAIKATMRSANPSVPTARAYAVRNVRMSDVVDGAAKRRREPESGIDTFVRRAHDRTPDDYAVRQLRDGARLIRLRDPESDAQREGGRRPQPRRRRRQLGGQRAPLARDAKATDQVHEAASGTRDLRHARCGCSRRGEPDERQRTACEPALALGVGAERQV